MESLQIAHSNFVPYRNWISRYPDVLDMPFLLVPKSLPVAPGSASVIDPEVSEQKTIETSLLS